MRAELAAFYAFLFALFFWLVLGFDYRDAAIAGIAGGVTAAFLQKKAK